MRRLKMRFGLIADRVRHCRDGRGRVSPRPTGRRGGTLAEILLVIEGLSCGYPDLTGLGPSNAPR